VIYEVNGQSVHTLAELSTALRDVTPSAPVVLHIDRRGRLRYLAFVRP
jgi:S1-C subfamily serine protease